MKKRILPTLFAVLVVIGFFKVPTAIAFELRASEQIAMYTTDVFATGNGELAIQASVAGTGVMSSIGIKEIKIYAQSGSRWILQDIFTESNYGMCQTDTLKYSNTIDYSGMTGLYYKVVVTVFAENANGLDSRTETHYITAR